MLFSVGDKVMHPLQGAGVIQAVCMRQCDGILQQYYALELLLDQGIVYIPIKCSKSIGLRYVSSKQAAQRILYQPVRNLPYQPSSWGCRYRENMNRIRSGSMEAVAEVVFCLNLRNRRRALAGSEKRMLEYAEKLLQSELMLILGLPQKEVRTQLEHQWKRLYQ